MPRARKGKKKIKDHPLYEEQFKKTKDWKCLGSFKCKIASGSCLKYDLCVKERPTYLQKRRERRRERLREKRAKKKKSKKTKKPSSKKKRSKKK